MTNEYLADPEPCRARASMKGVGQRRIRLESVVMGSIRYMSIQAVQRFAEALTEEPPAASREQPPSRRPEAARILDAAGVK